MSNIYIQEPPTHGKVLLETTVGDIDVELWSKEAPKACRNFVQLCLEGYYDGTIFHRVVKDFIVQGGDPTGSGLGGESIYGRPFRDEFHTRLRFVRRGLLAMANAGKDDNGSQFFFTLAPCPELQNKHTIFGKVTGNTIYNMLKLEGGLINRDDRPLYPHKIISTKVLHNPFEDIVPRSIRKASEDVIDVKSKSTVKKNFKLLSFGDEAEEDEEEANVVAKGFRGKSKSSHDLTNDPHLSSMPALPPEESSSMKPPKDAAENLIEEAERHLKVDDVRNKLKRKDVASGGDDGGSSSSKRDKKSKQGHSETKSDVSTSQAEPPKKNLDDLRKEVRTLKKQIQRDRHKEKEDKEAAQNATIQNIVKEENEDIPENDEADEADYDKLVKGYKKKPNQKNDAKGKHEDQTLLMLEKFKAKLHTAKGNAESTAVQKDVDDNDDDDDDGESDAGWLTHTLNFESREVLAKDANLKNEDTFEIYDPRNPINQRRREASKEMMKEQKHSRHKSRH